MNKKVLQHILIKIEKYRKKKHIISKKEVKILDYGCGKGESVIQFKEKGYENTYGVDINPIVIKNGLKLLFEKGYSKKSLELLDKNGKTSFPENYFDFVISNQVFEHIEDINKVINEIFRIRVLDSMTFAPDRLSARTIRDVMVNIFLFDRSPSSLSMSSLISSSLESAIISTQ